MAVKSGSFTATGKGEEVKIFGDFNVDLKNFGSGSVQLERSYDGGVHGGNTWRSVGDPFTFDDEKVGKENLRGVYYRLDCTVFVSGPLDWVLGSVAP